MKILERLRIERAVQSDSFWLDTHDIRGRRRRSLRSELRANLLDAATHDGARAAVGALGSVRTLAADVSGNEPDQPRWTRGFAIGVTVVMLTVAVELLFATAWLDGALAADPAAAARGSLTLFPGSTVAVLEPGARDPFGMEFGPGWLCLVTGLLAFLVGSRPWRAAWIRNRSTVPS